MTILITYLQNLEYARTLLHRLEHDAAAHKPQSRRPEVASDLPNKRERIKRLNQRLHDLNQLSAAPDSASESEDSLDEEEPDEDRCAPSYAPATQASSSIDTDDTTSTLRPRRPPNAAPAQDTATTTSSSLFAGRSKSPTSPGTAADGAAPSTQATTILEHHSAEQESLTASLVALASSLKASTNQFSASLEAEKSVLDRAGEGLDRNVSGMEGAQRKMGVLRRMTEGKGWLGRIMLYAWIAALWIAAFLIVFVGPKLRWK